MLYNFIFFKDIKDRLNIQENNSAKLSVVLGVKSDNTLLQAEISQMHHTLIASVCGHGRIDVIYTIIYQLLQKGISSDNLKFLMIDPYSVELGIFNVIPHMLSPTICDFSKGILALKWLYEEQQRRQHIFFEAGINNIDEFNLKAKDDSNRKMPHIICVINQFDRYISEKKEDFESIISNITKSSASVGIHLLIETQFPRSITKPFSSKFSTCIAFRVLSKEDSLNIIGIEGAEEFRWPGYLILKKADSSDFIKARLVYIQDEELENILNSFKQDKEITYEKSLLQRIENVNDVKKTLEEKAIDLIKEYDDATPQLLQGKLGIGYTHSIEIINELKIKGFI